MIKVYSNTQILSTTNVVVLLVLAGLYSVLAWLEVPSPAGLDILSGAVVGARTARTIKPVGS